MKFATVVCPKRKHSESLSCNFQKEEMIYGIQTTQAGDWPKNKQNDFFLEFQLEYKEPFFF